jgi:hypothetical protein
MGVYEAKGTLGRAMRDLSLRWSEARGNWSDGVRAEFERTHMEPIEQDLRVALAAMDQVGVLLSRIRQECR